MTHEFKTPVSTIHIAATVLADVEMMKDPGRIKDYTNIILAQNKRIEQQIEKVLQLARIEKNKYSFQSEEVDVHHLISEVIKSFGFVVGESGGSLHSELKARNFIVNADKSHLSNAIYNLIDNAIKYSNEKPDVTVSSVNGNDRLIISITDLGIGIEKKYLAKIFTKFFRVPTGNVHNVKGFGIGLSYVKNIVDAHGWKIETESIPGKGSTFRIIIPITDKL
jgi:two-component system phosphate regulon sensor histidine kinase PhoR